MSREFMALAVVVVSLFFAGTFTFLSFFNTIEQQQADLELSMAEMNKNSVRMHLFVRKKKITAKKKAENIEDL